MAPPNAFSNELEKWVYQERIGSVVFVEVRIKNRHNVKVLWERAVPFTGTDEEQEKAEKEREDTLDADRFYCTGFVVRVGVANVWILTCAHILGDSFSQKCPITPEEVTDHFNVSIICDHHEVDRQSMRALVVRINCGRDLMLLRVGLNALHTYCPEVHNAIPMAPAYPEPLETVVMLSWPPLGHRTAASGHTSHPSRLFNDLSRTNPRGFTCRMAQVDIASDEGSSGAPLLNGLGQFLCTLHGGFGSRFSYFVSFGDVRTTLLSWGVLE